MKHAPIVFTRFQSNATDLVNDIYAIDPDGKNEVRLTTNPDKNGEFADHAAPRYNRDRSMIAFLSTRNNPHKRFNIFFMDLASRKTAQITSGDLDMSCVDWSPDDARLVFSCKDDSGLQQVHVVNLDGTGFMRLTQGPAENMNARWSPRGDLIAFTQFPAASKTSQIWIMHSAGGDAVQLTFDETSHANPSWSPDGSWVVYRCDLGAPHLRRINVHTREVICYQAPPTGADATPIWSGSELVFSSNRDWEAAESLFNLYRMSESGEHVQRLTNNQSFEYCGDW